MTPRRRSSRRYCAPTLARRAWARRLLRLERLEDRLAPAVVPLTLADPRFWGDSGAGRSQMRLSASLSADGQRVVFESDAPNLVANDTNGQRDVFLYDRGSGRVSLVSVATDGVHSADRGGRSPRISADGRYVVFISDSANLVAAPPVNNFFGDQKDVYVRDLITGRTTMISSFFDGSRDSEADNANASVITTADGGAQVIWQSNSANMVTGDTNGVADVFVRKFNPDGTLGPTRLVSASRSGGFADQQSYDPQMTPDGRFVLFKSDANNLVAFDTNGIDDLFVRDLQANTTTLVSADVTGTGNANAHVNITDQAISADGRFVVFHSNSTNLVPQNTAFQGNAFVRDLQTGSTRLLSPNRAGNAGSNGYSATITPDGRYAAFLSVDPNLAGDVSDTNGRQDVFRAEITPTAITIKMVSVNAAGANGGNGHSGTGQYDFDFSPGVPRMTPDGRFVAFASEATDLAAGVTDGNNSQSGFRIRDVFVRDMQANATRAVSALPGGASTGNNGSYTPLLSADGRYVAFESEASNLVPERDGNQAQDILLRNMQAGTTELASRRSPLLPAETLAAAGIESLQDVTPDGRYVTFIAAAADLVPQIPIDFFNVYVRDRQTGAVEMISVLPNGMQSGGARGLARLSADGRLVAFTSPFAALDNSAAYTAGGVFVRDRVTGVTRLVSRNTTTNQAPNNATGQELAVSPDGRYVAFTSQATNLVNGITVPTDQYNLYLHDRQTGVTRMVNVNSAGTAPGNTAGINNHGVFLPRFSADGRTLVFVTRSSDLIAGVTDTNSADDIFAYDTVVGTTRLVSVSTTPNTAGNDVSGQNGGPQVSADGRYVVFSSSATNLTVLPLSGFAAEHLFRRDLVAGTTDLVSVNAAGTAAGNGIATFPFLSADGRKVLFQSNSSNLTALGNPGNRFQVYVRDFSGPTAVTTLVSVNAAGTAPANNDSRLDSSFGNQAVLTADGRTIAFLSSATDLVPGFVDGNGPGGNDLYLRDLQTGRTVLASFNRSGTATADRGVAAGQAGHAGTFLLAAGAVTPTVVFDTPASDQTPLFQGSSQVYAYEYRGAGSIAGTLFNDANGNGVRDTGEAGIPFWTIFLDANGNRRRDPGEESLVTDAAGNYRFTGLPAGSYSVVAVDDAAFIPTAPAFPFTHAVSLATDTDAVTGKDFGARPAAVDLVVSSVTAPATAQPGDTLTVTWQARNLGSSAITVPWQDAVYLSADATLDAGDRLIATAPHTGTLNANSLYTGTANVTLPAVLTGGYFLIVGVDRRHQVPNETNRANNLAASATPTDLTIPTLTPGTPTAGRFTAPGQDRYYRITVASGQSLHFVLDSAATTGGTELYVRRFQPPTPWEFDFVSRGAQPDQAVTIPITQPGPYFVLASSRFGNASASTFTITATLPGFELKAFSTNSGGNTGRVTVKLEGSGFTPSTTASLVAGTTVIDAVAVDYRSPSLIYATFDLAGRTLGDYQVRVRDGSRASNLADKLFQIVQGIRPDLDVQISAPDAVRQPGRASGIRILVEYTNTGNIDLPAPILNLTTDIGKLRIESHTVTQGDTVQFLGASLDGPGGLLRPGAEGKVEAVLELPVFIVSGTAGATVTVTSSSTTSFAGKPIDWQPLKLSARLPFISEDAWDAIWNNFLASVGATTDQLQQVVVENATYLSQVGETTADMDRLLSFELQQANATLPVPILASAVDAGFPTPGPELGFGRVYLQPISGRYRLGPLGRGWAHAWEAAAVADTAGDVRIEAGGGFRFFSKQADGTYRGSAGDHATLTLTNGVYRLREPNGTLTAFRASGALDYVEDTHGNRITAGYDAAGRLTRLTHSTGPELTIEYNAQGRIRQVTDPAGRVVTYAYDASGEHLTSVTDPQGTTRYSYLTGQGTAREHALASVTNPDGTHRFYDYDSRGRLIGQSRDGGAEAVTFTYDGAGGVTVTDATGAATTFLFDDGGNIAQVRDGLGRRSLFDFDANSNLVAYVSPTGLTYSYAYDALGNLVRQVDPLGHEVQLTYDPLFNQLTSLRDARGNTTRYAYDTKGDLRAITYPNGSKEQFSYDPLGNLTESINRRGRAIGYTHNTRGQVTRKDYADGSHVDLTYDARANLATATDSRGTITLAYDAADRLTRVSYPGGRFLDFTYDAGGRRSRSVDQVGFTVNYRYDAAGRLDELTDAAGGRIVKYAYDAAGRLARKDLGNGTFTTYEYDAAGQILHLVNHAPGGSVNSRFDYTYDNEGRRTGVTTLDGTTTYGYDETGQLTSVALPGGRTITYRYDAAGNRVSVTDNGVTTNYVTNNLNQYTSVGTVSYTYDADGNLISQTDGTNTTNYTFDDENQLIGLTGPGGTWAFEYDPFGDRVAATHDGQRTEYLIDPTGLRNVVGEYSGTGSLLARYTYGFGLISWTDQTGTAYYDFDATGSTAGLTGAAGGYVNRYSYLPFGETTTITASVANPFQFVGELGVLNDGSGLHSMRFRYYDAGTGRFTAEDPIGLLGNDTNFRRYVGNNPVTNVDPFGLVDFVDPFIAGLNKYGLELMTPEQLGKISDAFKQAREAAKAAEKAAQEAAKKAAQEAAEMAKFEQYFKSNPSKLAGLLGKLGPVANIAGKLVGPVQLLALTPQAYDLGFMAGKLFSLWRFQFALQYRDNAFIRFVLGFDPNDIVGPGGFGPQRFTTPDRAMPYTVHFENLATATAAAQEVFVTLPLDADLDWSTFELGDIVLSNLTVDVPAGLQSYQTRVAATNLDGSPLLVDVSAALDRQTGVVTWTFRSVDPATGEFPEDPFAGFLPPNDATHRGEGAIDFTIRSRAGLATGATIDEQASIVFDVNAPIATNVFSNAVDAVPPTSTVQALPATSPASFTVRWSGQDDAGGSGVRVFDVFVSDNGGPFTIWQVHTAAMSATYPGVVGHTYAFYSVATDNADNVQPTLATAQATTRVTSGGGGGGGTGVGMVVGAGPGGGPHVKVYNADGSLRFSFFAYDRAFLGGVRVATGDVTGDGVLDIVTAPGPGGGPHVKVFDGVSGAQVRSFFAYDLGFGGGVFVATGDVTGDGRADIVTGVGPGGGPHVKAFDGVSGAQVRSFFAYDVSFSGGVSVAAGDLTGDGRADIVTAPGPGGGPHVKVFNTVTGAQALSFFAYGTGFSGGVSVAVGDVTGDGRADLITSPGQGDVTVKIYDGAALQNGITRELRTFAAFDARFLGGVRVAVGDADADGTADIIAGAGPGGGPHVKAFDGRTGDARRSLFAFDPGFLGGVFVG